MQKLNNAQTEIMAIDTSNPTAMIDLKLKYMASGLGKSQQMDAREAAFLANEFPTSDDGFVNIDVSGVVLWGVKSHVAGFYTGYDWISAGLDYAVDKGAKGVRLNIASGGGNAWGCFELCEKIVSVGEVIQTEAVANGFAASAAFMIGSAANTFSATKYAEVGSIGVVMCHYSFEGALDKAGVKVSFITAPEGGDKAQGNPYKDLDKRAVKKFQARADKTYEYMLTFLESRGRYTAEAARTTQANIMFADEALALGLIDRIIGEPNMAEPDKGAAKAAEPEKEALKAAEPAAQAPAPTPAPTQAPVAAKANPRADVSGILSALGNSPAQMSAALKIFARTELSASASVELAKELIKPQVEQNSNAAANVGAEQFRAAVEKATPAISAAGDEPAPDKQQETPFDASLYAASYKKQQEIE